MRLIYFNSFPLFKNYTLLYITMKKLSYFLFTSLLFFQALSVYAENIPVQERKERFLDMIVSAPTLENKIKGGKILQFKADAFKEFL